MKRRIGSKLIWQDIAPAPFESGWSIFAKLEALDAMSPSTVRSMIALQSCTGSDFRTLDFRDSSWIDFERFSEALDVDQNRLRAAFLDQLGFCTEAGSLNGCGSGIKVCSDCLQKGYHSVFFELGFIDTCPWHNTRLTAPCASCCETVFRSGLRKRPSEGDVRKALKEPQWYERFSSCGHIQFSQARVGKLNELSSIEERAIAASCHDLLRWWGLVSKNAQVAAYLSKYSFSDRNERRSQAYLSAAETIAGRCPWPLGIKRGQIRTQRWTEYAHSVVKLSDNEEEPCDGTLPRRSNWDVIYRAVRRHLFRRYVRHHRDCWKELSNYRISDARRLDSDRCCPVSLAFATWRMSIEFFRNIEGLKSAKVKYRPIMAMTLKWNASEISLRSYASLIYVYFFRIWEEILRHGGVDSFSIESPGMQWNRDFIDALYEPNAVFGGDDDGVGEWTLIFAEYRDLQMKSFARCFGIPKRRNRMISKQLQEHWTDDWWGDAIHGQLLFSVRKLDFAQRNATHEYIRP